MEFFRVFDAVKGRGQGAVDALENYQQVVDTLQESYDMAVDALATMTDATEQLAAVSVDQLEAQAQTSLQNSLISKDEASIWNNAALSEWKENRSSSLSLRFNDWMWYTSTDFEPKLAQANTSLYQAINMWAKIDAERAEFDADVTTLAELVEGMTYDPLPLNEACSSFILCLADPGVLTDLSTGNVAADSAIRIADQVLASDGVLQRQVTQQETTVAAIESTYDAAVALETKITKDGRLQPAYMYYHYHAVTQNNQSSAVLSSSVASFQNELEESVQNSLNTIQNDYVTINSTIPILDARIAELERKIQRARDLLTELEQPVRYSLATYEAIDNPDADKSLKYSEISLDFKYSQTPSGILFFGETVTTPEKVLLQLVNEKLVYEYATSDGAIVTITSPVQLCFNCWFRVTASR